LDIVVSQSETFSVHSDILKNIRGNIVILKRTHRIKKRRF